MCSNPSLQQADHPRGGNRPGSSITKGLVNLMGGAIGGEPAAPGTVFQVELEGEIAEPGGEAARSVKAGRTGGSTRTR